MRPVKRQQKRRSKSKEPARVKKKGNNDKIFITISKKVTTKTPKNDGRKLNKSAAL